MNEIDHILDVHRREQARVEAVLQCFVIGIALIIWAIYEVVS